MEGPVGASSRNNCLRLASMPKCSDYQGKYAGEFESVIAYPVEVSLFPKPSITALANPVKCYPVD
jgi:hypothetical protein